MIRNSLIAFAATFMSLTVLSGAVASLAVDAPVAARSA